MRLVTLLVAIFVLPIAGAQAVLDVLDPEPRQDDCETGADASDEQAAPTRLSGPPDCVGIMTQRDTLDAFVFHAEAGQWVEVSLTPDGTYSDMSACVLGPEGSGDCFQVSYPDIREAFAMPVAGDVLVVLSWSGNDDIQFDYRFRAWRSGETPDAPQDDCGLGHGASNWYATADALAAPVDCVGTLAGEDSWDWYTIDALLGQQIDVSLDVAWWADHEICLYSPSGYAAGCSTRPRGESEQISFEADQRGAWWLVVYRYSGDATYHLRANVTGTPKNEAPTAYLDCPWLVEVNKPLRCIARLDDFDSNSLRVEARWQAGEAFEDLGVYPLGSLPIEHTYTTVAAGWMQLRVTDPEGAVAVARAEFFVHAPAPEHDDCGSGADAGDHPSDATALAAPVAWCMGRVHGQDLSDLYDYYAIEVPPEGGYLRAALESEASLDICAIDPAGADAGCAWWDDFEQPVRGGTWTIRVSSTWGEDAAYSLAITTRAFQARGDATLPTVGGVLPITLADAPVGPDLDGYFVDLPFVGSGIESLRVDGESSFYHVRFYDADGNQIGEGGTFTGEDFWDPTPIPRGATRVLVQREATLVPSASDAGLRLIAYW